MYKSLKIRINPIENQLILIEKQFYACRYIYNRMLALKQYYYHKFKQPLSIYRLCRHVTRIKQREIWLQEVTAAAITQTLLNLDKAYTNFYKKRARYPCFKSKDNKQSYTYPVCTHIDYENNLLKLPKIGWVKAKISRRINGEIRTVTISKVNNKHTASIMFKVNDDVEPIKEIRTITGLDMGLVDMITKSDGEKVKVLDLSKEERNLRKKQQKLSRKKKGSKNRLKAKLLVTKAHAKIVNKRNHFQHCLANNLVSNNDSIVIESVDIKKMMKVPNRSKLASRVGWYEFTRKLNYKLDWQGKHFIKLASDYPSTKTCFNCKLVKDSMKIKERIYICADCEYAEDRDINAAKNIRYEGIQILKEKGLTVIEP